MPDNKSLNLTGKDRSAAADELGKLRSSLAFMSQLLADNKLNTDEAKCHLSLIKFAHDSLAALFHMDPLSKDLADTQALLRKANADIEKLKKQLADGTTSGAAAAKITQLENWFETWYQLSGFHYMTTTLHRYGISFESSDQVEHAPILPEDITFGDKGLAIKIQPVMPYAFGNADLKKDTFHDNLLDTGKNRDLLIKLFKNAFPNIRINGFMSHTDGPDEFMLRMKGFIPWEDIEAWHAKALENAGQITGRNTGSFYVEIAEIAYRLANKTYTSHAGNDMIMRDRMRIDTLRTATGLWELIQQRQAEDGETASKPLELDYGTGNAPIKRTFPAGTEYAKIRQWFEVTFKCRIEEDLTGNVEN